MPNFGGDFRGISFNIPAQSEGAEWYGWWPLGEKNDDVAQDVSGFANHGVYQSNPAYSTGYGFFAQGQEHSPGETQNVRQYFTEWEPNKDFERDDVVQGYASGTQTGPFRCVRSHKSTESNKPATGAVWRKFWVSLEVGSVLLPGIIDSGPGGPGRGNVYVPKFLKPNGEPVGIGRNGFTIGVWHMLDTNVDWDWVVDPNVCGTISIPLLEHNTSDTYPLFGGGAFQIGTQASDGVRIWLQPFGAGCWKVRAHRMINDGDAPNHPFQLESNLVGEGQALIPIGPCAPGSPGSYGGWWLTVLTYDGTYLKLYLNGSLVDQTKDERESSVGISLYEDSALYWGTSDFNLNISGHWNYFRGMLDEAFIYDGPMSPDVIRGLAQRKIVGPIPPFLIGGTLSTGGSNSSTTPGSIPTPQTTPAATSGYPSYVGFKNAPFSCPVNTWTDFPFNNLTSAVRRGSTVWSISGHHNQGSDGPLTSDGITFEATFAGDWGVAASLQIFIDKAFNYPAGSEIRARYFLPDSSTVLYEQAVMVTEPFSSIGNVAYLLRRSDGFPLTHTFEAGEHVKIQIRHNISDWTQIVPITTDLGVTTPPGWIASGVCTLAFTML